MVLDDLVVERTARRSGNERTIEITEKEVKKNMSLEEKMRFK